MSNGTRRTVQGILSFHNNCKQLGFRFGAAVELFRIEAGFVREGQRKYHRDISARAGGRRKERESGCSVVVVGGSRYIHVSSGGGPGGRRARTNFLFGVVSLGWGMGPMMGRDGDSSNLTAVIDTQKAAMPDQLEMDGCTFALFTGLSGHGLVLVGGV
jgi:hypothetical protein